MEKKRNQMVNNFEYLTQQKTASPTVGSIKGVEERVTPKILAGCKC